MSSDQLSKYSAKIKNVYIELKDYRFFHSPYDNPEKSENSNKKKKSKTHNYTKDRFIGRNKVKERIISILEHTDIKSGSYLITGFRGMGKTSVIRQAIDDYNAKSCQVPYVTKPVDPVSKFLRAARIALIYLVIGYLISVFYSADPVWNPLNWEWDFSNWKWTLPRIALLVVGTPHVIHTILAHRKGHVDYLFLVPWNVFRIVLVVSTVLLSIIFFLNYQLVCDIGALCLTGDVGGRGAILMENLFPVNYKENVIFSTIFRIVIGLVFSFLILSVFLFSFDLLSLVGKELVSLAKTFPTWLKSGSNKEKTEKSPENRGYVSFEIYLSQDSLEEMDVLRRMAMAIEDYWLKEKYEFDSTLFDRKIYLPWNFLVTRINRPREESTGPSYKSVLTKLSGLRTRMSGQVTTRKEMKFTPNFKTDIAGGLAELSMPMGTYSNNDEIVFPVANAKEAEYELKEILNDIEELRNKQDSTIPQFVFIIDELDKIEPNTAHTNVETDAPVKDLNVFDPDTNRFRQRREAVAQLLANLKGFLSVVKAKVFFIGGREMFDADLADISDRESFYSSIFNDVIYVESFFKDTSDESGRGKGGITQMTEAYVCKIILNNLIGDGKNGRKSNLGEVFASLKNHDEGYLVFEGSSERISKQIDEIKEQFAQIRLEFRKIGKRLVRNSDLQNQNQSNKDKQESGQDRHELRRSPKVYFPKFMYRMTSQLGHIRKHLGRMTDLSKSEVTTILEQIRDELTELSGQLTTTSENRQGEIRDEFACFRSQLRAVTKKLHESDETRKQKYKVIFTLQNFIIFLIYRSNGTPKKLTGLTEQLIVRGPAPGKNEEFFRENLVVLHESEGNTKNANLSRKLFLKFSFNTQYEIGLTSNLYRPYLIANSRHLKSLGDKLLFSSSFIIDHILKFHPFGFSWRNLELIPEIVLVNREPNLREFIEDLMRFYSLNYIRDTVSGIFDYRFRSIIRRELILLSKTSDLSAAAFNFTLDESLSTKQHYKAKLVELQTKYKDYKPIEGDNQFVHSLCFVQTILGDLHFYDKEYDEAILYYTESIQTLRLPDAVSQRQITRHQFLLWLRNKLKLGLTLEKMRAFDSAFSLYKTLTLDADRYFQRIMGRDTAPEKRIGRERYRRRYPSSLAMREAEDHRTIQLISMPFVALLAVTEKARNDGITYTNLSTNRTDFLQTINAAQDKDEANFDPYRKYFLQADYYNNVGSLLYYKNCQFSKVFDLDGQNKIFHLEAFESIEGKNPLLKAQNALYNPENRKTKVYNYFPSLTSFNYYWNSLYFLLKYHTDDDRILHEIERASKDESKEWEEDKEIKLKHNFLALACAYFLPGCNDMVSDRRLYYIANVVSKIGDSILASLSEDKFELSKSGDKFELSNDQFDALDIVNAVQLYCSDDEDTDPLLARNKRDKNRTETILKNIKKLNELVNGSLFHVETVLYTYKLAAVLYQKAGHNAYYASHLLRILYVVKDVIELNKGRKLDEFYSFWGAKDSADADKHIHTKIQEIAEKVFQATTWNNEVTNRPQIQKYKEIFNLTGEDWISDRHLIYNHINNIPDLREVIILVESIKMKLGRGDIDRFINDFTLGKSITSSYGSINNRYQRMLELKYRMERCYFLLTRVLDLGFLFQPPKKDSKPKLPDPDDAEGTINENIKKIIFGTSKVTSVMTLEMVVQFLIKEALFCSRQLINMIRLYNPGYVIGYSFIAAAHSRMGDWCQAYRNHVKLTGVKPKRKTNPSSRSKFEEEILKMLGTETLLYLEPKNHYETALLSYHKMVQIHSDGKSYTDKLHDIYMLEDDYNDSAAHYAIASERLRINTGVIERKIADLNAKIKSSKLYEYSSYFAEEEKSSTPSEEKSPASSFDQDIKKQYRTFLRTEIKRRSEESRNEG